MGRFGYHIDELEVLRQLAEEDPKRSTKSCSDETTEYDETVYLKPLFCCWVQDSRSLGSPEAAMLSYMFRFALRRPLMPERALFRQLRHFGIDAHRDCDSGAIYDIAPEHGGSKIQSRISTVAHSSTRTSQIPIDHSHEKDKEAQNLRKQLWRVYDDVEDGIIALEDAPQNYNSIRLEESPARFSIHSSEDADMNDIEMVNFLVSWGIPAYHIPMPGQAPFHYETGKFPGRVNDEARYREIEFSERSLIRKIANYVRIYRNSERHMSNRLTTEVIANCMKPLVVDNVGIEELLEEHDSSPVRVAFSIWEAAEDESSSDSLPSLLQDSISSMPSFDGPSESLQPQREKALRSNAKRRIRSQHPCPKIENQKSPVPGHPDLDKSRGRSQENIRTDRATYHLSRETNRSRSPSPECRPSSLDDEGLSSNSDKASQGHSSDLPRKVTPSPQVETTNNLFGIRMPTEQARCIAQKLGLKDRVSIQSKSLPPPPSQELEGMRTTDDRSNFGSTSMNRSRSLRRRSPEGFTEEPKQRATSHPFASEGEDYHSFFERHIRERRMDFTSPSHTSSPVSPESDGLQNATGHTTTQTSCTTIITENPADERLSKPQRSSTVTDEDRKEAGKSCISKLLAELMATPNVLLMLEDMESFPNAFPNAVDRAQTMLDCATQAVSNGLAEIQGPEDELILTIIERITSSKPGRKRSASTSKPAAEKTTRSPEVPLRPSKPYISLDTGSEGFEDEFRKMEEFPKRQENTRDRSRRQESIQSNDLADGLAKEPVKDNLNSVPSPEPEDLSLTPPSEAKKLDQPELNSDQQQERRPDISHNEESDLSSIERSDPSPKEGPGLSPVEKSNPSPNGGSSSNPNGGSSSSLNEGLSSSPSEESRSSPTAEGPADDEWARMPFQQALEMAQKKAHLESTPFHLFMQSRRAIRAEIKRKRAHANENSLINSYFNSGNTSTTSSSSTSSLHKLFDKYRGKTNTRYSMS